MNHKNINSSPDRLKLLKSTLRSNTAVSENTSNNLRKNHIKKAKLNNSEGDQSLYDMTIRKPQIRENSTCTPMKAVHPKARFHSEIKYSQGSPVKNKNNTMQMNSSKLDRSEESKSPLKIKIKPKKVNSTNSKVMQMLSDDTPVEDEGKYLNTKDLPILEDPEKQFKQVYKDMLSTDWQKQVESWNTLRSIAVHHKEILLKDWVVTRVFIQSLTKQLESLRSSVSKNALLGFKDILESLK